MKLFPVDHWVGKHTKAMIQLLESRGMAVDLINDLPEIGVIAYRNDIPVAAGFIRRMEGSYGLMDSYITNATESSSTRHKALSRITEALIEKAKEEGISKLLAFSSDQNTYQRSLMHGFIAMDHKFSLLIVK
jgi:hypothetical protein